VSWSTSIESPRHPSICSSIGPASLLMNAMPASTLSGLPLNVVERAYTTHSSLDGAVPGPAPPVDSCLLPWARGRHSPHHRALRFPTPSRSEVVGDDRGIRVLARRDVRQRRLHERRTRPDDDRPAEPAPGVAKD